MNIFVLDKDIAKCAEFHCDLHVVKMILESAQMLCTVCHENSIPAPYKPTHLNHPCTIWAGESLANWLWLRDLAKALNEEFKFRFDKDIDHKSAVVARDLQSPPIEDRGLTEFAQAIPEEYRVEGDAVAGYRAFYIAEKAHFARWTKRPVPDWFANSLK